VLHAIHTIVIEGLQFRPNPITVAVRDRIVWVNHDPFWHTVVSTAARLQSPEIAPGRSWAYRAKVPGTVQYRCPLHPTMEAMFRVE